MTRTAAPRRRASVRRWEGPQFVLTRHAPETSPPGITFVDNLQDAVAAAKAAAGGAYVNVLGADVARQCLEHGLLDEILTLVAPVLLGDGTPLFRVTGGTDVALERRDVASPSHVSNLWCRVLR